MSSADRPKSDRLARIVTPTLEHVTALQGVTVLRFDGARSDYRTPPGRSRGSLFPDRTPRRSRRLGGWAAL